VFVLAAAAAAAFLLERGRLVPALLLAAPLAVGLAWSNVAAYREVNLAPRAQLHELESIGKRFSGQGPALITDYQPYGARHLLRKLDAEGASELRRRQVPLRDAPQVPKGGFSDIDEFQLEGLAPYRTLVIRRSPAASRPSSSFDLAWRGTWYEVWRRRPGAPPVVEHLPAGDVVQPSGRVACAEVRRLAREAGRGGRLATGLRPRVTALALSAFAHPPSWTVPGTTHLLPSSAGIVKGPVAIDTPGRYRVWIGGSFHGRLAVEVDGRSLGSRRHVLNQTGGYVPFGATPLGRGTHQLELRYARPAASPGSAGPPYPLGPLVLATGTAERKVTYVEPSAARSLCERPVDWVEAVGPA